MTKVLVEIRGGALACVSADGPVKLYLADWDNIGQGEKAEDFEISPVSADKTGKRAFARALRETQEEAARVRQDVAEGQGAAKP